MRNRIAIPSLAILCSVLLAAAAWAQPRTYTVYRAQTPPKIDGLLDDDCWRAVPWQTGFTLLGGGEVAEPAQTEFAMAWDDASLYVAVRCTDSAMDRLVAKAEDGSKDLLHDDHVEIFLAPEKQRDDYAQFAVNSLGKKIDLSYQAKKETAAQAISKGGQWISACRRGKTSWELEMALPLAALKIEPREGVAFVGNIGRVRWADPPAKPINYTWTPQAEAFDHDTAAFGLFKLAGAPPPAMRTYSFALEHWRDMVSTLQGDRFTGAVAGIGADGWLHLSGPQFGGDVSLATSVVSHVEFAPAREEKAGPRVVMNNGDYVLGQVQSISADQTVIANPEIGTLTAPTASLTEILMDSSAANFVDTGFEWGALEPWTAVQGNWTLADGKAACSAGPQGQFTAGVLSVPLEQSGPVTFFADVELPQAGAWLDCELFVYSDRPDLQNMHNGVCFHLKSNDSGCAVVTPEAGVQNLGSLGHRQPVGGQVPLSISTAIRSARWRDSAVAERCAEPGRHAGGPVPVHHRPEDRAIRAVRREHAAGRLASPRGARPGSAAQGAARRVGFRPGDAAQRRHDLREGGDLRGGQVHHRHRLRQHRAGAEARAVGPLPPPGRGAARAAGGSHRADDGGGLHAAFLRAGRRPAHRPVGPVRPGLPPARRAPFDPLPPRRALVQHFRSPSGLLKCRT